MTGGTLRADNGRASFLDSFKQALLTPKFIDAGFITIVLLILSGPSWPFETNRILNLAELALLSAAMIWIRWNEIRIRIPFVVLPLLAWMTLSAVWSDSPMDTLKGALLMGAVAFVAILIGGSFGLRTIAMAVGWLGIAALVLSIGLALVNPSVAFVAESYNRGALEGIYPHRNVLAFVLVIGIGGLLATSVNSKMAQFARVAAVVALWGGIWWTNSSTAKVSASLLLLTGFVLWAIRRREVSQRPRVLLILGMVVMLLIVVVAFNFETVTGLLGRDSTLTNRTLIWHLVLESASAQPWIGFGWDAVWSHGAQVGDSIRQSVQWDFDHAHNGYLDVLIQTGIIGTTLLAITVGWAAWIAISRAIGDHDWNDTWPALLITSVFIYDMVETASTRPLGWGLLIIALTACASPRLAFTFWPSRSVRLTNRALPQAP